MLAPRLVRGWVEESRRSIHKPKFKPSPASWNPNAITATWLGHATVLLNFYGVNILTDPVLFGRIGADTPWGTVGPKRLVAPALEFHELPPVDVVLLSHAHMDHFDFPSLRRFSASTQGVTSDSTSDLLRETPLRHSRELAWGEKTRLRTRHGDLSIEAFEVNHWGARWKYDRKRGYNGYILEREGRKIIFGGDTAWTDSFRALRDKGPFDFAIMPIGAYNPWIFAHCSPEQAARMADDAGAAYVLPVHFKTLPFGRESADEPMERLRGSIEKERIGWSDVGQTFGLS